MIMRTVKESAQNDTEDLVNDLKAAGTIVTKKTIGNTLDREGLKSCSACKLPLLMKAHVQHVWRANDSEENWVKVLWSNETKIQLFGINSGGMLPMTPRTASPNMEVETLCFGVFFF